MSYRRLRVVKHLLRQYVRVSQASTSAASSFAFADAASSRDENTAKGMAFIFLA
jgi:hypothetical protein